MFYRISFYDDEWLARYEVGENNIGRYDVKIGSRSFDTVAILEICGGIMTILYVDKNGRTVLFRRYNRFNWKTECYKALWTDKLPDSEVLAVNNEKYVHWYDCIGEYVI